VKNGGCVPAIGISRYIEHRLLRLIKAALFAALSTSEQSSNPGVIHISDVSDEVDAVDDKKTFLFVLFHDFLTILPRGIN